MTGFAKIARGFAIVNFAFTLLDDKEAKGNHTLAILKVSESYDNLAAALHDIIEEAKDLEILTVDSKVYQCNISWEGTGNSLP